MVTGTGTDWCRVRGSMGAETGIWEGAGCASDNVDGGQLFGSPGANWAEVLTHVAVRNKVRSSSVYDRHVSQKYRIKK